jgi:heme-degrading monooxygenase HmoA
MVTIGMNYFVREGREQVFEDACARVVETMQGIEGHDESHLYRRIGDGGPVYLIVSRWDSEKSFQDFVDFVASDAFKKVTSWGKENILTGPPRHTTYRED